jgi:hypothetical protein
MWRWWKLRVRRQICSGDCFMPRQSFQELDASAGKVSSGLMTEVGEALVATAVGLLVALPAVAAFNAFHRIIQVRLTRGSALGRELLAAHFASVAAQKESDVHEQESEAA